MAEFSNPNQQGGQDNKSLFAMMLLFIAVLIGAEYYHSKIAPPPAPSTTTTTPTSSSAPGATPAAATTAAQALAAPSKPATPAAPTVQATSEATTVVENELYKITFSNRGAQVVSWVLKGKSYVDSQGKQLDLVNAQAAKLFGYPLSFYTYDGASVSISSVSRTNHIVTLTSAGNLPAGLNGQVVSISSVSDSSFNGTYVVTQAAPNTLTYTQDYGDNANSNGGTVSTVNGGTALALNNALFVPSATGSLTAPATLTFKYSNGDLQATKTFTFDASYVLHAEAQVTHGGAQERVLLSWPGGFGDQNDDSRGRAYSDAQFDNDRNGSDDHLAPKKITGGATLTDPYDWAGVSDPFFGAVFLPDNPATATFVTLNNPMDVSHTITRAGFNSGSAPTKAQMYPILGAAFANSSGPTETRIFVGPKAISVLKGIHAANPKVSLEPLLEFGFWGFIGKYLFLALQLLHSHIAANWGWDIVILTVFINILMLPFKVKTMQSALKMQRIQPQIDAIKEKYKKYKITDPKRNDMNVEIMDLQKKEGVNMFGGCIPTLITFPFLMAFFYMVPKVVELRQAHWYWLPNLQAPDPWHILPILMVLSQFLVQFYTPSPGVDPQQQKMMAFMMPAFSGYICWLYPSGLALYWSTSNLIGIAQQAVMNRTSLGREMREIAAKRARRKGGASAGGKTIPGRK